MKMTILISLIFSVFTMGCNDSLDINKIYDFELHTLPVPKEIHENETVEIRCEIVQSKDYEFNEFKIRYFQTDGKGELKLMDGTILTPNDLFTLNEVTFRLYYTSKCSKSQMFDIYIIDSF